MDTNACIAHFSETTDLPPFLLEQAIPPAIDAVYTARDTNKFMHEAGASAAVAALQAIDINSLIDGLERATSQKWREEMIESHDNWMHRAKTAEYYLAELLGLILDETETADFPEPCKGCGASCIQDCDCVVNDVGHLLELDERIEKLAIEARANVFPEDPE